jgi:hypothetical protein
VTKRTEANRAPGARVTASFAAKRSSLSQLGGTDGSQTHRWEGDGFEPSVPRYIGNGFVGSSELGPIYRRTAHPSSCRPRQTDRVVGRGPARHTWRVIAFGGHNIESRESFALPAAVLQPRSGYWESGSQQTFC